MQRRSCRVAENGPTLAGRSGCYPVAHLGQLFELRPREAGDPRRLRRGALRPTRPLGWTDQSPLTALQERTQMTLRSWYLADDRRAGRSRADQLDQPGVPGYARIKPGGERQETRQLGQRR